MVCKTFYLHVYLLYKIVESYCPRVEYSTINVYLSENEKKTNKVMLGVKEAGYMNDFMDEQR